ncbi:DUF6512 family protein [Clostridium manihotivorum]|uniref:Uncharacterized protein n=1 Tax=Clostridium manihotivorum TaxID=2320868 RepID=A0A3R5TCN7_9CLOT|nr:hypothetical protein C1I91_00070 [Clostridium manihotivorum]
MKYKKNEVFIWELTGIPLLILLGLSLSFTYKSSNRNFIIGLFSVINTSLWEQLKISFFPIIFYSLIEKAFLATNSDNFFIAKATSFIFMSTFLSLSYFFLDFKIMNSEISNTISILLIGYTLSQFLSCIILNLNKNYSYINLISFLFLIITSILFFAFTINPPNNWLFTTSKHLLKVLNL